MSLRHSIFLLFFLLFALPQHADALVLKDLKTEVVVDPGTERIVFVEVENDSDEAVMLEPRVDGFTVEPETGRPLFDVYDEAVGWIELQDAMEVAPGSSARVPFLVRVPAVASPGGHYIGLFLDTAPGGGQVGVGSSVGSLLFLQIAGEQREEVHTVSFDRVRGNLFSSEQTVELTLQNRGTVRVQPFGQVTVTDMFGAVVGTATVNKHKRVLFQGMELTDEMEVVFGRPVVGPLTVTTFVRYGVTDQAVSDSFQLWAVSPVIALGVGLVAGACALFSIVLQKRRKNQL